MERVNPEKENADPVSDEQKIGTSQTFSDNEIGRAADKEMKDCESMSTTTKRTEEAPRIPEADDFTLLKAISRGAFGKVFIGCKKKDPDKVYAIKVMKKSDLINKNLIAQVTMERDALAMIHSPFVVEIYYSLQSQQNIYLVMEYLAGGDIKSLLAVTGYLEEDMAAMYVAEVTLALEHLHRKGIIHRDLKPDNMLIAGNGHIKLTDFGLSKVALDVNSTPLTAGQMTPMSRLDQYRTPGQVLSLRSSLAFSAPRSNESKQGLGPRDSKSRKSLLSVASPSASGVSLGRSPMSPLVTGQRHVFRVQGSKPGSLSLQHKVSSASIPSGISPRTPKPATPLVKSLTPTLKDSLRWKHSSSMDTSDPLTSGLPPSHSSSLFAGDLSHIQGHQGLHDSSLSSSDDVFSSTHHELKDISVIVPSSGERVPGLLEGHVSSQEDSLNTTPLLYRTNESVHKSLSARSLRSFREGSSLEEDTSETEPDLLSPIQHRNVKLESVPEESESQPSSQESVTELSQEQNSTAPSRKRGFEMVMRDSPCEGEASSHTGLTQEVRIMQVKECNAGERNASRLQGESNLDPLEVSMDYSEGYTHTRDSAPHKVRITSRDASSSGSEHSSPPKKLSSRGPGSVDMGITPLPGVSVPGLFAYPALSSPETELEDANISLLSEGDRSLPFTKTEEGEGSAVRDREIIVSGREGGSSCVAETLANVPTSPVETPSTKASLRHTKNVEFKADAECYRTVRCMSVTSVRGGQGMTHSAVDWTDHSELRTPERPQNKVTIHSDFITPQRHPHSVHQPLRTPKEGVRRGPEPKSQEEERILGTPDYLAPEILRQEKHGPAVDWWALGVCLFEFLTGLPPFNDETPELVFRNILNRAISWPTDLEELGESAMFAINALLTMDPSKRPAAPEVKAMTLFSKLDWDRLLDTEPLFIPQPDDIMDTSYFDPKNNMQQLTISAVDL